MENSWLKERLISVTKNPEYIRPPAYNWVGNEPNVLNVQRQNIKVYELAYSSVEFSDYTHHVILRMLADDGQTLQYSYMISDTSIYNTADRIGMLDMLHQKSLRAIIHHCLEKEYGKGK
jgi:hypothetical protein